MYECPALVAYLTSRRLELYLQGQAAVLFTCWRLYQYILADFAYSWTDTCLTALLHSGGDLGSAQLGAEAPWRFSLAAIVSDLLLIL